MKPQKLFYILTRTSNREEFIKLLRQYREKINPSPSNKISHY